jgi:CDP-glucose 4,6-dehydratase
MSDFWTGRRVLVTGISGFLGGWLARKLTDANAEIFGFDLDTRGVLPLHGLEGAFPVIEGSVLDPDAVTDALQANQIEVCVHLAGQSMIEGAAESPLPAWEVNVRGTWIVLEACRLTSTVRSVATASSNHAYGPQKSYPHGEDAPFCQLDTYGASKASADLVTRTYARAYGVPAVAVRNTNSFGPVDPHNTHIVTGSILSILQGQRPVIRSDGRPTKAYLYVEDTVEAYMALCEGAAHREEVRGEGFNVTADEPISVIELVGKILEVAGSDLAPDVQGAPDPDPEYEYQLNLKGRKAVGWSPRFSLEEGLRLTLEWYREHGPVELAAHTGLGSAAGG